MGEDGSMTINLVLFQFICSPTLEASFILALFVVSSYSSTKSDITHLTRLLDSSYPSLLDSSYPSLKIT